MRQLLFLSLLACFVALTSCKGFGLDSIWEDDLYELCPGDEFDYNGLKVNSFLEMRGTYTLYPIGYYAISLWSRTPYKLFDEQEAKQILEIKDTYNRHLVEMYEEKLVNDPHFNLENEMNPKFTAFQTNLTSFKGKSKDGDWLLDLLVERIEGAKELCKLLTSSKSDKPVPEFFTWGAYTLLLRHLKRTSDKNATMVFLNEKVETIYNNQIYKFGHYEKIRDSKLSNDWSLDYGRVNFRMPFPVQQHDSKYVNKTRPCVEAKKLPPFYRLKGKVDN